MRAGRAVRGTITVPDVGRAVGVKLGTAIRHLTEMAEVATEQLRLGRTPIGWPLTEMWAAGALLESSAEWVGKQLQLGSRRMLWSYRLAAWPAWSCRNQEWSPV